METVLVLSTSFLFEASSYIRDNIHLPNSRVLGKLDQTLDAAAKSC